MMKAKRVVSAVLALGLLLGAVAGFTQAQEPGPEGGVRPPAAANSEFELVAGQEDGSISPENLVSLSSSRGIEASPTGLISYQGRLLHDAVPYNGSIDITFRLYDDPTAGYLMWEETQAVQVNNGLFDVMLGAVSPLDDLAVYFANQQWLSVQPAGAASELTPRQPMGAVGYAMNLMPGATLVDHNVGGIYGYSFFVTADTHPAIYGWSGSSTGITGGTSADNAAAVYGSASGSGNFSHGLEGRMSGATASCPMGEAECGSALYATASGDAYASYLYGQNRSAMIAMQGDNTYYGLWVDSLISPDGNGIWTDGASYFGDYVTFGGGKSGYVVDIALNDGTEPLEKGDVVVISGYDAPVVGSVPVVRVRKATAANSEGVMGVVDVQYVPCADSSSLQAGQACGGFETSVTTIRPGEYLGVVTLGAYEAIKVDATAGPIRPGDLLATSVSTGHAMKAAQLSVQGVDFYAPGTIIGKALGSLEGGTGVIPVFVSSR
jgi:hypothetical protein